MASASPLSSQDVESSPSIILSMNVSSDRQVNHKFFDWWKLLSCAQVSQLSIECFTLVLSIWFLVLVALTVGIYGPKTVWIGPNASIMVDMDSIFVESVKVENLNDSKSGLELFGFHRTPPLDVFVNWSDFRLSPLSQISYKGWPYYLNKGSSLNISYTVKPEGSSVQFVVKKGGRNISESFNGHEVLETAGSWNLIQGSGVFGVAINESSSYYVAVANLKRKDVMVELDIKVKAILYDTKESFYKCSFSNGHCTFDAKSSVGSYIVLTSRALSQVCSIEEDEWYIRLSYKHRWMTYVTITGLVICFMLVATRYLDRLDLEFCGREIHQKNSARALRKNKDKNVSSTNYDADLEESMVNEGEASRRVCVICFDAPRDCFFLPCGHCASCYKCGRTISRTGGKCPICRMGMKKVKRLSRV